MQDKVIKLCIAVVLAGICTMYAQALGFIEPRNEIPFGALTFLITAIAAAIGGVLVGIKYSD